MSDDPVEDPAPEEPTVNRGILSLSPEERRAAHRFASGPFKGQTKISAIRKNFEWFLSESARIAVDMEQGKWVNPETGKPHEGGRYVKRWIGKELGFPSAAVKPPRFFDEPGFTRAVQWERIRREADMRMSAVTVKPLVAVAASALLMELLNRALNAPEKIKDRELLTECRKYIEMVIGWDEGKTDKPHIQTTLQILFSNIQGLPASSRAKVKLMLGRELERSADVLKQLEAQVSPVVDE